MKTAIITAIDDNYKKTLENDFLETLRNIAKYAGLVYVIYYGKDKKFAKRIEKKYNVKIY